MFTANDNANTVRDCMRAGGLGYVQVRHHGRFDFCHPQRGATQTILQQDATPDPQASATTNAARIRCAAPDSARS